MHFEFYEDLVGSPINFNKKKMTVRIVKVTVIDSMNREYTVRDFFLFSDFDKAANELKRNLNE